jgi:hypothetical protein
MSDDQTAPPAQEPLPRPEKKATLKLAQRELTRISTAVVVVIVLILCVAAYRTYKNFKAQRDIVIARGNLLALYKAFSNYAQDWDGKLPPADRWTDAIAGYLSASPGTPGGAMSYLHGPGDHGTLGYVYNDLAAGFDLDPTGEQYRKQKIDPRELVLLIEKPDAEPNAHVAILPQGTDVGEEALAKLLAFPHYEDDLNNATSVVIFANGTPVTLTRRDLKH